jgi:hypothetical protein
VFLSYFFTSEELRKTLERETIANIFVDELGVEQSQLTQLRSEETSTTELAPSIIASK